MSVHSNAESAGKVSIGLQELSGFGLDAVTCFPPVFFTSMCRGGGGSGTVRVSKQSVT